MGSIRSLGPLGFLAGVAVLVSVASLALVLADRAPGNSSPEAGFARDMSIHHAQAVEMAQIVQQGTEDEEINNLASDMAITQQGQIGRMHGWLSAWGLPISGSEERMLWMGHEVDGQMPGMATAGELNELRNAEGEEAEEIFLRLMIPHHQAAVPMSEAVIERSGEEAVTSLAQSIADSQQSEIEIMRDMREDRGFEPLDESPAGGEEDMQGMDHEDM